MVTNVYLEDRSLVQLWTAAWAHLSKSLPELRYLSLEYSLWSEQAYLGELHP